MERFCPLRKAKLASFYPQPNSFLLFHRYVGISYDDLYLDTILELSDHSIAILLY